MVDSELIKKAKEYLSLLLHLNDDRIHKKTYEEMMLDLVIENMSLREIVESRLGKYELLGCTIVSGDKPGEEPKFDWHNKYTVMEKGLEINPDIDWKQYISEEELDERLKAHRLGLFDSVKEVEYDKYDIGMDERDTNVVILRSPAYTWEHLGGREWRYNIKEDMLWLSSMN